MSDDPAAGAYNRPDYISPLDDLAFDMYQDPEVAQIIRKLERKKQEAVLRKWNGVVVLATTYVVVRECFLARFSARLK